MEGGREGWRGGEGMEGRKGEEGGRKRREGREGLKGAAGVYELTLILLSDPLKSLSLLVVSVQTGFS